MLDADEKDREYWGLKTYTSKTLADSEFDDDGTFKWDCCNIHYCKKHRKRPFGKRLPACLRGGGRTPDSRCSIEEKQLVREEALAKGFDFSEKAP